MHACAALHEFPERMAEIAGIAVDEQYLHLGVGPKLVDFLSERARKKGLQAVFALTTQTADWFQKLGFVETETRPADEKCLHDRKVTHRQRRGKSRAVRPNAVKVH